LNCNRGFDQVGIPEQAQEPGLIPAMEINPLKPRSDPVTEEVKINPLAMSNAMVIEVHYCKPLDKKLIIDQFRVPKKRCKLLVMGNFPKSVGRLLQQVLVIERVNVKELGTHKNRVSLSFPKWKPQEIVKPKHRGLNVASRDNR
jgi:hypothetical protein